MVEPQSDQRSRRVDAAIAEYLESVEQGALPDEETFLAGHTDVESELREFLTDYRALRGMALRAEADLPTNHGAPSTKRVRDRIGETPPLPRRFGQYELLEEISRGGMGVVYKARQEKPNRIVALKMILAGQLASQADIDRFFVEAQATAALDHPHIVPIFEVGEQGGQHYFTMGYVTGESLAERLMRGPLPPSHAAVLVRDVALAVQYAHDEGVIHRDLKPANILVDASGRVRITDFGLAKRQTDTGGLTCTGQLLGTPSFMSPEQVAGKPEAVGPAADIYALGATLYALLSGRPPFQAASTIDTLKQVVEQDPVPLREFDATIPRDLETIVLKCLEKAPARRYQTARELADDLQRFLSDRPILARRATPIERITRWCRRNSAVAALAVAVAVLLTVAIAILAVSNSAIRREAAAKDVALSTARAVVDRMLTRVANDKLSNAPLAHPLRNALLQDALSYYEELLQGASGDPAIRGDMHGVLNSMGCIQRELGLYDDACRSFQRSIALLVDSAPQDPADPSLREELAATEKALAFTWKINPAPSSQQHAETHFRRTLQMYRDLDRDFPDRRQPIGLCLRHVAELAFKRGDAAEAERMWRESITAGEAYLVQQPGDLDARSAVCWSCADLADAILLRSPARLAEAEAILQQGLRHVAVMLEQNPRSTQARQVAAFLHLCQGRRDCNIGRVDEAIPLLRQSAQEMQSLCTDFPSHDQHWDLVRYTHQEVVSSLQAAERPDAAEQHRLDATQWLDQVGTQFPGDQQVQAKLERCRLKLLTQAGK